VRKREIGQRPSDREMAAERGIPEAVSLHGGCEASLFNVASKQNFCLYSIGAQEKRSPNF